MTVQVTPKSEQAEKDTLARFAEFVTPFARQGVRHLVLVQPALVPKAFFDVKTARSGGYYNFPPTGLLYLAAAARRAVPDLKVSIIDLNFELLKAAHQDGFDYDSCWQGKLRIDTDEAQHVAFGISYMFGTTKPCFAQAAAFLREAYPAALLMAGGVQATFDAREIIESGMIDLAVTNEGEEQLVAVLKSLRDPTKPYVPQGSLIAVDGRAVQFDKPPAAQSVHFDLRGVYPLVPIEEYHRYGGLGAFSRFLGEDQPFSTVLSRRGCRARCTFCTVRNFNGLGVRKREVRAVIDELKYLVHERGITNIDWLDDDLLFDRDHVLEMFNAIADELPGLKWTASNGLIGVSIDDEVMDAMARSGLQAYKIGIESGNDRILHKIKKPTTKKKLRERKDIFTKHKHILFSTNLILGFPEETFSEMMDTFLFAQELEQDWASFYIMQPLKGTEMYSSFQSLGDERCSEESYDKTINPGRSAERGEFGYRFEGAERVVSGWDVFKLSLESRPSLMQQKEIWFTFNLSQNFLNNANYGSREGAQKLLRWLRAIFAGYPYDASMAAALAHCQMLLDAKDEAKHFRQLFIELTNDSPYWRNRCHEFPELFLLAGVAEAPAWFDGRIPERLFRHNVVDAVIKAKA